MWKCFYFPFDICFWLIEVFVFSHFTHLIEIKKKQSFIYSIQSMCLPPDWMVNERKVAEDSSLNNCPVLTTIAFWGWWPGFQLLRDGLWSGQFSASHKKNQWQISRTQRALFIQWGLVNTNHPKCCHFWDWRRGWGWGRKPQSKFQSRWKCFFFVGDSERALDDGSPPTRWTWPVVVAGWRGVLSGEVAALWQVEASALGPPDRGRDSVNLVISGGVTEPQRQASGRGHHLSAWYTSLLPERVKLKRMRDGYN